MLIVELKELEYVQQGNNISPVMFIFLMAAFVETLDKNGKKRKP